METRSCSRAGSIARAQLLFCLLNTVARSTPTSALLVDESSIKDRSYGATTLQLVCDNADSCSFSLMANESWQAVNLTKTANGPNRCAINITLPINYINNFRVTPQTIYSTSVLPETGTAAVGTGKCSMLAALASPSGKICWQLLLDGRPLGDGATHEVAPGASAILTYQSGEGENCSSFGEYSFDFRATGVLINDLEGTPAIFTDFSFTAATVKPLILWTTMLVTISTSQVSQSARVQSQPDILLQSSPTPSTLITNAITITRSAAVSSDRTAVPEASSTIRLLEASVQNFGTTPTTSDRPTTLPGSSGSSKQPFIECLLSDYCGSTLASTLPVSASSAPANVSSDKVPGNEETPTTLPDSFSDNTKLSNLAIAVISAASGAAAMALAGGLGLVIRKRIRHYQLQKLSGDKKMHELSDPRFLADERAYVHVVSSEALSRAYDCLESASCESVSIAEEGAPHSNQTPILISLASYVQSPGALGWRDAEDDYEHVYHAIEAVT